MKMTYIKVNINSIHCVSTAYKKVKGMTKIAQWMGERNYQYTVV